jgi:ubiquinol-cytochrome c reductase cytochrome b subunit/menaquinol-cytochrome c reductase cytochrome b/c subunit
VNKREREQYLREYGILKAQGKPFFPYAILKDGTMAMITLIVIILLSLILGAELGPKADPTTTSYTPRPEWYFFFLFELLRVIKPPALVFIATVGIPTVCMVLLILLPFIDRNPERHPARRPIATATAVTVIALMAYLTVEGAIAGAPGQITLKVAPQYAKGKAVAAQSGCQGCHKIGENGNAGPGPDLTHIGSRLPRNAIARTLVNPTAPMPSFDSLQKQHPQQFNALVDFLASLK